MQRSLFQYCKSLTQTGALLLGFACLLRADSVPIPHGTVELVAEYQSIHPGHRFYAGLRFNLESGWHIYWINPGDAGQPPRVTWRVPEGIEAGAIEWPFPKTLPASSVMDFGYEGEVLLLVPMETSSAVKAGSVNIGADMKLIVCRDVCIPGKAQLTLSLPVKSGVPTPAVTKPLFDASRAKLPRQAPAGWRFKVTDAKDTFQLVGTLGRTVTEAAFFPLEESQIENAASQKVEGSKTGFRMTLKKSNQLLKPISRLRGVLVLGDKAYVIQAPIT